MPINRCKSGGSPGYRWGPNGIFYPYSVGDEVSREAAKEQANMQGAFMGESIKGKLVEITEGIGRATVDTENHIVRGVKILGMVSKNNRRYARDVMQRGISHYEGSRVNVDHPENGDQPRSYASRFGSLVNVTLREGGLYGDLNYNPKHQLAAQFEHDAEHSPASVGLSHNIYAQYKGAKDGVVEVTEIDRVVSVDLVADPATTNTLFESEEGTEMPLTIEAVKAEGPILEALRAEWLKEQTGSDEAKELAEEIKNLRTENDKYKAAEELARKTAIVAEAIKEAKLPEQLITKQFTADCVASDATGLAERIAERQEMAKMVVAKPQSKEKVVEGDTPAKGDFESFIE